MSLISKKSSCFISALLIVPNSSAFQSSNFIDTQNNVATGVNFRHGNEEEGQTLKFDQDTLDYPMRQLPRQNMNADDVGTETRTIGKRNHVEQYDLDRYLEFLDRRYNRLHTNDVDIQKNREFPALKWLFDCPTSDSCRRFSSQLNREDALYALGVAKLASERLLQKHSRHFTTPSSYWRKVIAESDAITVDDNSKNSGKYLGANFFRKTSLDLLKKAVCLCERTLHTTLKRSRFVATFALLVMSIVIVRPLEAAAKMRL